MNNVTCGFQLSDLYITYIQRAVLMLGYVVITRCQCKYHWCTISDVQQHIQWLKIWIWIIPASPDVMTPKETTEGWSGALEMKNSYDLLNSRCTKRGEVTMNEWYVFLLEGYYTRMRFTVVDLIILAGVTSIARVNKKIMIPFLCPLSFPFSPILFIVGVHLPSP